MTGEILQKHEMTLAKRIEDNSTNNDKSKHDQKKSLIWLKSTTSGQSELIEDKVQPIQFILGV
ncbi:MAG TPA: hypothetical protein VK856_16145 [Anaerolineaceae bacterium]|nr:hypothetical protein [Anaerolineaceae bacterium]